MLHQAFEEKLCFSDNWYLYVFCYLTDLHQKLSELHFDHINTSNCTKMNIFTQFDPLSKNKKVLFPPEVWAPYSHYSILYEQ